MKKITFIILFGTIYLNPFDGLILVNSDIVIGDEEPLITQLLDVNENVINTWTHDTSTSGMPYLSPDSILYVICKINNFGNGPANGRYKKINWMNEIIWDFTLSNDICIPHHDIEILPNGNILSICSENKTIDELIEVGMIIDSDYDENFLFRGNMDMLIEIEPVGSDQGNIVWEWHFWDHLIQDISPSIPNHGIISENPQLININAPSFASDNGVGSDAGDWMHCNSISYNDRFDQIVISSRHRSEFYVIDHSTSIEESASHQGGLYGKGGDFLYRWGNPQNYERGNNENKILGGQHSVIWIPSDYTNGGDFLLFNNFHDTNSSAVLGISPPVNLEGEYSLINDSAYGPDSYNWIYTGGFYSGVRSGVCRLPNGNTLITSFSDNRLFEINNSNDIVWSYTGDLITARAIKYSYDYFNPILVGDLNEDLLVNILDIVIIVNIILDNNEYFVLADINNDDINNILDIIELLNIILN